MLRMLNATHLLLVPRKIQKKPPIRLLQLYDQRKTAITRFGGTKFPVGEVRHFRQVWRELRAFEIRNAGSPDSTYSNRSLLFGQYLIHLDSESKL